MPFCGARLAMRVYVCTKISVCSGPLPVQLLPGNQVKSPWLASAFEALRGPCSNEPGTCQPR